VRRLVPNLRRVGITIDVDFREAGTGRRLIEIKRSSVEPSQSSQATQPSLSQQEQPTEKKQDMGGRDSRDGRDATPESVTVGGKGETEWEA